MEQVYNTVGTAAAAAAVTTVFHYYKGGLTENCNYWKSGVNRNPYTGYH
jgi:hypothetical protein